MDSTTPDPQPQQQPQQQQQQQQQPQQQPQPQPQQPQPQQHLQPQPTQQPPPHGQPQHHTHMHPHQTAQAYSMPPYPPYGAHQPFPAYPPQFATAHYSVYNYASPWPGPPAPANFNMVTPQPKSNVPQHNKPQTHAMSTAMNADRSHNQNQESLTVRERRPATLRDPKTKQVLPLDEANTSSKTSSTTSKPTSPNVPATTATTLPGEHAHVHALLQRASGADNNEVTNNKQQQSKESTIVSNKAEDNKVITAAAPPSSNTANKTVTIATTNSANITNASVPQEAIKDNEKVTATKVELDNPKKSPSPSFTPTSPKLPSTEQVEQQAVQAIAVNTGDGTTNSHVVDNGQGSNDGETKEPEEVSKQDNQDSTSKKEETSIPEEKKVNGNEAGDDSNSKESDSALTLQYQPGQFNPVSNRSGKRVYTNEFLRSIEKIKFKKLDSFYTENEDRIGTDSNRLTEPFDPFNPNFCQRPGLTNPNRQNEPARRQSQHNYMGRGSAGQEGRRIVITSASLTQEVELKTVANPWKPGKEIKETAPPDEVETESLKKKFRSILNKLTPNNFDSLSTAVTELHIDTESKLGEVIDIVFAKALAEPGYCVLYGQMCSHLKKTTAGQANFGNTLLKRCQHQFQSDIYSGLNLGERREKIDQEEDPEIKKQLEEELYEDMYRSRMRGLGLIKFIGELYKIEMLNDAIMFACIDRLLTDTSEESIECLCDLLATIGEKLDKSSSQKNGESQKKPQKSASKSTNAYREGCKSAAAVLATPSNSQQKNVEQQQTLDQVFDRLHKIRKDKESSLSLRIRFKLLDTCDLREKHNWQSKKAKDNNPKKIEEIREAHKEKLEQERRQNAAGPRRSQEGRRGLGHSSGSSSQISSLANESGGNRGSSNMHTSSSSHTIRDSLGESKKSNQHESEGHKTYIEEYKRTVRIGGVVPKESEEGSLRPLAMSLGRPNLRPMGRPNPGSDSASDSNSNASLAKAKSPDPSLSSNANKENQASRT